MYEHLTEQQRDALKRVSREIRLALADPGAWARGLRSLEGVIPEDPSRCETRVLPPLGNTFCHDGVIPRPALAAAEAGSSSGGAYDRSREVHPALPLYNFGPEDEVEWPGTVNVGYHRRQASRREADVGQVRSADRPAPVLPAVASPEAPPAQPEAPAVRRSVLARGPVRRSVGCPCGSKHWVFEVDQESDEED